MTEHRAGRLERLAASRLYLCTDSRREQADLETFVTAAVIGGVDIVQLREKGLEAQEELRLLGLIGTIARAHGALLAVNDRADLAHAAGADVLHLGQDDLTPAQARAIVGEDILIGRSTHDEEQGELARADSDVDYYCVGPVWATPTKPGRPAAGIQAVRAAGAAAGHKPWFAIGGIDAPERLDDVIAAGAERIVVVRAITRATEPREAAHQLRSRLTG